MVQVIAENLFRSRFVQANLAGVGQLPMQLKDDDIRWRWMSQRARGGAGVGRRCLISGRRHFRRMSLRPGSLLPHQSRISRFLLLLVVLVFIV